jgi:hypothetical protein
MNELNKEPFSGKLSFYFMFFMSCLYLIAGAALLTIWKFEELSQTSRYVLGTVLFVYGTFRIYTLIKRRGK